MKIATWNVNSLRARRDHLLRWLESARPDVVALQELKQETDAFPQDALREAGYEAVVLGQKTYNGVALLARQTPQDVVMGLPNGDGTGPDGADDTQARYIEATVGPLRVAGLYLPNGNPIDTDKFGYKLRWMDRFLDRAAELHAQDISLALIGDYNVCPTDRDVHDPAGFADDALCQPDSRARFRRLVHMGFVDALRARHPDQVIYTYFDYQAGAWQRRAGLRIDHILLSPRAADRLEAVDVDLEPRGWEKASDHCPVWCTLDL